MTVPPRRLRRIGLGLFAAATLSALVVTFMSLNRDDPATPPTDPAVGLDPPTPDPRLTFDTPYRNVKPHVKYVGDATCAKCHPTICKTFHDHPMGRSADFLTAGHHEKYPANGKATFASGPFDLTAEKTAEGVRHRVGLREPAGSIPDVVLPVHVAIGSGTRGRSYLTVENGCVWQTPVSWFGPDERWDLSPGFRIGRTLRRPVAAACLYCHTDAVEPVSGAINRFREPLFTRQAAIGCERCHGPGELHASERGIDLNAPVPDTSIVNPIHLTPSLQRAVCEQCHLQGQERVTRRGRDPFEFRPGLPFDEFVSVFVRHPDIAEANKSVGQFEQMESSECFKKSGGTMTCTSCHDPHAAPTPLTRDVVFRNQCLNCHQGPGRATCTATPAVRNEKRDSCIACHMPKADSSNITHASVTNHRVPRVPSPPTSARQLPYGTAPLVRFRTGATIPPEERDRDLGIALARYAKRVSPREAAARGDPRGIALSRLKASLTRWPGDAEAWEAFADARGDRGDPGETLKAAKNAVRIAPHSESALTSLAAVATTVGDFDLALQTVDQWVALNPASFDPLLARAFVYLKRGDWVRAEADCRAALKFHPFHAEAHLYLAICRYRQGDPAGGENASQTAASLETDPREKAYLRDWYRRATR